MTTTPSPTQFAPVADQLDLITKGVAELIPAADSTLADALAPRLEESRRSGTPLRIKAGFDPTAPDLHLGHTVLMRKLRHFQQLGHTVIFLIGDSTALIGDPTGKNVTRKPLTHEEIAVNAESYKEQVFKILDAEKTEVRYNSEWLDKLGLAGFIKLAASATVSQMLDRKDFNNRFQANEDISLHELLYPLMQGYDSVALHCDVELGGTDQKFNLMRGRDLQRDAGQKPQIVLMTPILEGLDGVQKMSKSLGNAIGIHDPAPDMYGKLMSISDDLMWRYYTLLTDLTQQQIEIWQEEVRTGKDHPMRVKKELARLITTDFHSPEAADHAAHNWATQFQQKGISEDLPEVTISLRSEGLFTSYWTGESGTPGAPTRPTEVKLPKLLVLAGLAASGGEAQRKIKENAVSLNGEKTLQFEVSREALGENPILRLGKRAVRIHWSD